MQPASDDSLVSLKNVSSEDLSKALQAQDVRLTPSTKKSLSKDQHEYVIVCLSDKTIQFEKSLLEAEKLRYRTKHIEAGDKNNAKHADFFQTIISSSKATIELIDEADEKAGIIQPTVQSKEAEEFQAQQIEKAEKAKKRYAHVLDSIPKIYDYEEDSIELLSRRVAQIHGDLFLESTGFEGNNKLTMMQYLQHVVTKKLELVKKSDDGTAKILSEFLTKLDGAIQFEILLRTEPQHFASTLVNKIEVLPVGQSLLVGGGWTYIVESQGHVMFFEITKQTEHTCSLKVFNIGAGVRFHASRIDYTSTPAPDKPKFSEKYAPYVLYENIPETDFSINFWELFKEINSVDKYINKNNQNDHTKFNSETIYKKLLGTLTKTISTALIPADRYMLPQSSGTCSKASLWAALFSSNSEPHLKHFEYEIEIASLKDIYRAYGDLNLLKEKEDIQNLMLKSALQLAEKAPKLFRQKIISVQELEQANALVATIKIHVTTAKTLAQYDLEFFTPPITLSKTPLSTFSINPPAIFSPSANAQNARLSVPPTIAMHIKWDPNTFDKQLMTCCEQLVQTSEQAPIQILTCIGYLITSLPMPRKAEDFWQQIPAQNHKACMQAILNLTTLVHHVAIQVQLALPPTLKLELTIGMFKCQAILHKFASFSKVLKEFDFQKWGCQVHLLLELEKNTNNVNDGQVYESQIYVQLQELQNYFNNGMSDTFLNISLYEEYGVSNKPDADDFSEFGFINKYFKVNQQQITNEFTKSHKNSKELLANLSLSDRMFADVTGEFLPFEFCFLKQQMLLTDGFCKMSYPPLVENTKYPQVNWAKFLDTSKGRVMLIWGKSHSLADLYVLSQQTNSQKPSTFYAQVWYFDNEYVNSQFQKLKSKQLDRDITKNADLIELQALLIKPDDANDRIADELQIPKLIAYFSAHRYELLDPDYQRFFRRILFQGNLLTNLLKNSPEFMHQISRFIVDCFQEFKDSNKITGMLFMIYMQQMLMERNLDKLKTVSNTSVRIDGIKFLSEENVSTETILIRMLNAAKTPNDKALISRQLLFQYHQDFPSLNEKQIHEKLPQIILAFSLYYLFSITDEQQNQHIKQCINRLHFVYLEGFLQRSFGLNNKSFDAVTNAQLSAMVKQIALQSGLITSTDAKIVWSQIRWENHYPQFKGYIGNQLVSEFNTSNCLISVLSRSVGILPAVIRNNNLYNKLFKTFNPPHVETIGTSQYTFKDALNLQVILYPQDNTLIIQRQLSENGPLYQYTERVAYINPNYVEDWYWTNCSPQSIGQIAVTKANSLEIHTYLVPVSNDLNNYKIIKKNRPDLTLLKKNAAYGNFSNFESPYGPNIWVDKDGIPALIEFPRSRLNFHIDTSADGTLVATSDQVTGFHLADEQRIPFLGTLNEYLVLQNQKGEKRVIIKRGYADKDNKGGLRSSIYLTGSNKPSKLPPYYEYTVDAAGNLTALHEGGNLYLAYILLAQGKYKQAQTILRDKSNKLKRYSKREMEIFEWFAEASKLKDNDPKFTAVALTAMQLLLKNKNIYGLETSSLLNEFIKTAYEKYLESMHSMVEVNLTVQEENTILTSITDSQQPAIHLARRDLLESPIVHTESSDHQAIPIPKIQFQLNDILQGLKLVASSLSSESLQKSKTAEAENPKTSYLFEDPDKNQLFFTLYAQAKSADAHTVSSLKTYGLFHGDEYIIKMLPLLIGVAEKAYKFPKVEELRKMLMDLNSATKTDVNKAFQQLKVYVLDAQKNYANYQRRMEKALIKVETDTKYAKSSGAQKEQASNPMEAAGRKALAASPKPMAAPQALQPIGNLRLPARTVHLESEIFVITDGTKNKHYIMAQQLLKEMSQKEFTVPAYAGDSHLRSSIPATAYVASTLGEANQKALIADVEQFAKQESARSMAHFKNLNPQALRQDITKAQTAIDATILSLRQESIKLHDELIDRANKVPTTATRESAAEYQADLLSGKIESFTAISLALLFIADAPLQKFQEINPFLTIEDVLSLRDILITYLHAVTEEQAFARQSHAFKDLEEYLKTHNDKLNMDPTFSELSQKAFDAISAQRAYNPAQNLPILLFEAIANIALRKDQVDDIHKLGKVPYIVLQKIMASGKSKVLLPILALTLANGKNLPVIILPEALFETTSQDLNQSLGNIFHRFVHALHFERNTKFEERKLTDIYNLLKNAQKNRECILMTSKSLACLALKFKEACLQLQEAPTNVELFEKVKILNKILTLLQQDGKAIIDEADLILNVRSETNFTLGDKIPLNPSRCNLISDLYFCLQDASIKKIFGGDPLVDGRISSEEYHQFAKPAILAAYIKHYKTADQSNVLGHWLHTNPTYHQQVENFLLNKGAAAAAFVAQIKNTEIRDLLSLLKEELNNLLYLSLNKRCCVDYGPSEKVNSRNARFAIPYSGNNKPVESSEFRSPDLLMNYTLQMWWSQGLTSEEIEKTVVKLRTQAQNEQHAGNISIEKTEAYALFKSLCGKDLQHIDLLQCSAEDYSKIASHINDLRKTDPRLFINYISDNIFVSLKLYQNQLVFNASDLTGMFKSIIAFTGTPWNKDSYAEQLRSTTEKSVGADGKSLTLLYEQNIRVLPKNGFPENLESQIRANDRNLIDAAATFNGHDNQKVARKILELLIKRGSDLKGVVFYQNNKIVVLEIMPDKSHRIIPLKQSKLAPESRFTYYDHVHSTGADIQQADEAVATVTIGTDVSTRDLTQGAWRMRGLDKQQLTGLALTAELSDILCKRYKISAKEINFLHIIAYTEAMQQEQQISHIITSLPQKIGSALKKAVTQKLMDKLDTATIGSAVAIISSIRHILASTIDFTPFACYGEQEKLIERDKIIDSLLGTISDKIKLISEKTLLDETAQKEIFANIIAELNNVLPLLPSHLSSTMLGSKNSEGTQEQEQEVQAEKDFQIQAQKKTYHEYNLIIKRRYWCIDAITNEKLARIFTASLYAPKSPASASKCYHSQKRDQFNEHIVDARANTELLDNPMFFDLGAFAHKYQSLFKGLMVTQNRLDLRMENVIGALHNTYQIPTQYILCIWNDREKSLKIQLLDAHSDLAFFWEALSFDRANQSSFKRDVSLCIANMNGDILQHDRSINPQGNKNNFISTFKVLMPGIRLKLKLIFAEIPFTKEDVTRLPNFLQLIGRDALSAQHPQQQFSHDEEIDAGKKSLLAYYKEHFTDKLAYLTALFNKL